jgi:hypothetical protein
MSNSCLTIGASSSEFEPPVIARNSEKVLPADAFGMDPVAILDLSHQLASRCELNREDRHEGNSNRGNRDDIGGRGLE